MKLSPLLIGAISAQSGDDADRWDNTDFSLADDIFTYEQPKDPGAGRFDASQCDAALVIQAVTCWESNHMGNLDHYVTTNDDGFGWKNIHHGHDQGAHSRSVFTTGTGQGTTEGTNYGKTVASTSPEYQIGTYTRGMVPDTGSSGSTNRIDYHSAMAFDNRYSGCIYEAAGWDYNATSYNKMFRMSYGYDPDRYVTAPTTTMFQNDASGIDKSNSVAIRPNWWHYFNSHILNVGMFDNNFDEYGRHLLVMANPAYEGLGFLNWITTFAKQTITDAGGNVTKDLDGWAKQDTVNEGGDVERLDGAFASSGSTSAVKLARDEMDDDPTGAGGALLYTKGRYRGMINHNTQDTVTDLFSGGYAFHLAKNCKTYTHDPTTTYQDASTTTQHTDEHMNPEINLLDAKRKRRSGTRETANTETNFWKAGANYDAYKGVVDTNVPTSEISEWYSYLINPGNVNIKDNALEPQVDSDGEHTLYPWMSMAAVSSFPHNDLGQDFRFNIRILHYGGRGFPYLFTGNAVEANNVLTTGASRTTVPGGVTPGDVGIDNNFTIMSTNIKYLAQDSYYWYKVNTVQIAFPSYVRCPRYPKNILQDKLPSSATESTFKASIAANSLGDSMQRDERIDDTFRCMDSGNFNGHRGWDSSEPYAHTANADADTYSTSMYLNYNSVTNHRPDTNYPYYIEQLTENDGSAYQGILVSHNKNNDADTSDADDKIYDNENGFICGDVPPYNPGTATLTNADYKGEWYKCGQKYTVHGLMNTYDEHAQLEYGTMQEIWFQFWYHYVINFDTDGAASDLTNSGFWDKRDSNTNRKTAHNTAQPFHDGQHDDAYFTFSNYKNNFAQTIDGAAATIYYDHLHNFPNILFNAFELRGIRFYCDHINSFNSNTCFHTGQDAVKEEYTVGSLIGDSMLNP